MSWTSRNGYLNQAEKEGNAREVARYAQQEHWSKTALCAILGNMEAESGINPGIWENLVPYDPNGGYGLTQWTPYTKLSNWATSEGLTWEDDGETQLMMLSNEAATNQQWFYNSEIGMAPPISFEDFLHDDNYTLQDMTNFFLWFYEHPLDPGPATQAQRFVNAEYWWNFLGSYGMIPIWLMFKMRQ